MKTDERACNGTDVCAGLGDGREPGPRAVWFVLCLAAFTMFFNLWGRGIENKDYVRYAEVARETVDGGNWLTLRLGGEYYVDKPPLHFWKIAAAYKIFGVNAGSARVPSAAFAVLGAMLAYFYGARVLRTRAAGMLAALMLLGSFGYFWWGRRTRLDMEFGMLVSVALVCFHLGWEEGGTRRRWWYAAFWAATGVAFLDKGPIALSGCAVVLVWVVVNAAARTPGLRARFGPGAFFATLPVVLAPIAPWALALCLHPQFGAYWDAFAARHIANSHEWLLYYLHELPVRLLPWSPLFLYGLWECVRLRKDPAWPRELGFALTWAGTFFFMLNLTSVKDHRYLLVFFIPCLIVSAWTFVQLARRHADRCARLVLWSDRAFAAAALVACAAAVGTALYYRNALVVSLLTVAVLAVAFFVFRRHATSAWVRLCISVIICLQAFEAIDVPRNERASPRLRIANILRAKGLSGDTVAVHWPPLAPAADPKVQASIRERRTEADRLRDVLSFYFNRLLAYSEDVAVLMAESRVRAIIMDRTVAHAVQADPALGLRGVVVELDAHDPHTVLFLKHHD